MCLGLGYWLPEDERARRANIDGTQVPQCFGQLGRSESPVAPDVNSSKKNNECHSICLNESAREVTFYRGGRTSGSGRSTVPSTRPWAVGLCDLARRSPQSTPIAAGP